MTFRPGTPDAAREVIREVAARHRLTIAELVGESRKREIAWPRIEAMARIRALTGPDGRPRYTLPRIGQFFGRDHTTVLSAVRRWAEISASREAA